MKILSGSLKNKIIAVTALSLLGCIFSAIVLADRTQRSLDMIKSRDICTIYRNVLRNNEMFHIQKVEKAFRRLMNMPELEDLVNGKKNETLIVLQGMFISISKSCSISHLVILDNAANILFSEHSRGTVPCPPDIFRSAANQTLLKEAAASSLFESRTVAMDGKPYLLGVTAITDDDEHVTCYLAGLIPPEALTDSFAKAVDAAVAFQDVEGKIICSSSPEFYSSVPESKFHGIMSDTHEIIKTKDGIFMSYAADIHDHGQLAGRFLVSSNYKEGSRIIRSTNIALYLSMTILFFISLSIIYLLLTYIIRPVRAVESILKKIADGEGDLTRRIIIKSKDEIGRMSRWFNFFVEKVQKIVIQIAFNAEKVLGSTEALHFSSENISAKTADVSIRSDHVTAIIKNVSLQIAAISEKMSDMSLSVNSLSGSIEQINSSLGEIAIKSRKESQIASDAEEHIMETKMKIDELGKASNEIGSIVEMISDIAGLTNLLSVNATIEAARSGEAGKGFVVVAGEIKSLARQTAEATKDVEQRVSHMQRLTDVSVRSIDSFSEIVTEVNSISKKISGDIEQQAETISMIAATINSVSGSADSIADNVRQAASALSGAASSISAVNSGTSEVASGISEINLNITKLNELSQELGAIVSHFRH